jgi:hypothetical protein
METLNSNIFADQSGQLPGQPLSPETEQIAVLELPTDFLRLPQTLRIMIQSHFPFLIT